MISQKNFKDWGIEVIRKELAAIAALTDRINDDFAKACEILLNCRSRIIVVGLGKSGHIGNKIAATLASTGSPAFFVHAAEAAHGDFGMITADDCVLAISNSGKTGEILNLLPFLNHLNVPLISMTGNPNSPLAKAADINLNAYVAEEAGPDDLAPTCSTTVAMVLGDALAMVLLQARGFTKEDFARSHPGGTLGKRLLLTVEEVMRKGHEIPIVPLHSQLKHVLMEMTAKRLGMTTVVDEANKLVGIFTDGDLRRTIEEGHDLRHDLIENLMTRHCKTTTTSRLAYEAFIEMEQHKITAMPVIDEKNQLMGIVHLHDILQAGVI